MWIPCELSGLKHKFATCAASVERVSWCRPTAGVVLTARMSATPPPKDAFAVLMHARQSACPPDEPQLTAVLYEAHLEHVDPSEPLWRVPYFGQIVRVGTAEAIFAARKREHETAAAREDKDLGLHAVIDRFGPDAMAWRIVSFKSGPRSAMQELADAKEKRLISENGGVLRDMDERLTQTLNLTNGGQCGNAAAHWASIDAKRRRALNKFKASMEAYVEEYESALVPYLYVDGEQYPLGQALSHFRQGVYWRGLPEERQIEAWAIALPDWTWNATKIKQFGKAISKRRVEWWKGRSQSERLELSTNFSAAQKRPEVAAKRDPKHVATCAAKRQAKWNKMSPKARRSAEAVFLRNQRNYEKLKIDLKLLRASNPDATFSDVHRARREGSMPKSTK